MLKHLSHPSAGQTRAACWPCLVVSRLCPPCPKDSSKWRGRWPPGQTARGRWSRDVGEYGLVSLQVSLCPACITVLRDGQLQQPGASQAHRSQQSQRELPPWPRTHPGAFPGEEAAFSAFEMDLLTACVLCKRGHRLGENLGLEGPTETLANASQRR